MSDIVIGNTEKIVSTLKYLLPLETSQEELDLLNHSSIEIKKIEKGVPIYGIYIKVKTEMFVEIEDQISSIERNVMKKAQIIFKWFPGCGVSEVRIMALSPMKPGDKHLYVA